jgi:hypothetical protein
MCPDCGELIDARRTAEDLEALGGYAPTKDGEAKPGSLGWHSCTAGRRASMAQTSYDWRTHGR